MIMTSTSNTPCSNNVRHQRRCRTTATLTGRKTSTKWALLLLVLAVSSRSFAFAFSVQRPLQSSLVFQQHKPQTASHPCSLLPSTRSRRTCATATTTTTTSSTRLYVGATSDTTRSQKARRVNLNANQKQNASQKQKQQEASVVILSSTATATTYNDSDSVYRNGLWTVGLITVLFASNSPAVHAAFSMVSSESSTPPVLLINAAVSCVALMSVKTGGPVLDKMIPEPSLLMNDDNSFNNIIQKSNNINTIMNLNIASATQAGMELGLWKFLGTTANLYGLSLTSAGHGAFLIQLTTLLVPAAQGIMGVAIPARLWSAIALALSGVVLFTQDTGAGAGVDITAVASNMHSWQGDALCAVAAIFYATYDLRLFQWGQRVAPLQLITNKVTTQAALSVALLTASVAFGSLHGGGGDFSSSAGLEPIVQFFKSASARDLGLVGAVTLWSGMIVNGIVPYLQVGGQQAVGPARAQILYASQPLWAALMSFCFLGETVGPMGAVGGTAFLAAMATAATAEQSSTDE